jgi:hypothetical protein
MPMELEAIVTLIKCRLKFLKRKDIAEGREWLEVKNIAIYCVFHFSFSAVQDYTASDVLV